MHYRVQKTALALERSQRASSNDPCGRDQECDRLKSVEMIELVIKLSRRHLSSTFDVDARDLDGTTALHEAAARGNKEGFQALVKAGADPKAVDSINRTALHRARQRRAHERTGLLHLARAKRAARLVSAGSSRP